MLRCVMCITNEGVLERFELGKGHWCTIDKITVKMSDNTRLRRYAVCVDGRWLSDQQMSLREARAKVEELKQDYSKPVFKPLTVKKLREFAKVKGTKAAYDALLLWGYGSIEGTCKDYDDLLKEFEGNVYP